MVVKKLVGKWIMTTIYTTSFGKTWQVAEKSLIVDMFDSQWPKEIFLNVSNHNFLKHPF